MITITLQNNASENIAMRKDLTDVLELEGNLRTNTSLQNPVIVVECSSTIMANVNYLTIEEFNRSYFIREVKSVGFNPTTQKGLWEISTHVDVLESFRSEILENSAIIARNENNYNMYLDDGIFRLYQNPKIKVTTFPHGFNNGSGASYMLAVAGS